jgi:hypothetical protein
VGREADHFRSGDRKRDPTPLEAGDPLTADSGM